MRKMLFLLLMIMSLCGCASGGNIAENKEETGYAIDSLSVDEILEECEYYFSNSPEGKTREEYQKTLKVAPLKKYTDKDTLNFAYPAPRDSDKDTITSISVTGSTITMDGSFRNQKGYYSVRIDMSIHDYDRAAAIYEALLKRAKDSSRLYNMKEYKHDTQWSATADFNTGEELIHDATVCLMQRQPEGGYWVMAADFQKVKTK